MGAGAVMLSGYLAGCAFLSVCTYMHLFAFISWMNGDTLMKLVTINH